MDKITTEAAKEWFINYAIEKHNYSRPLAEQIADRKKDAFWDLKINFAQSMVDKAIKEYKKEQQPKEQNHGNCVACKNPLTLSESEGGNCCDECWIKS